MALFASLFGANDTKVQVNQLGISTRETPDWYKEFLGQKEFPASEPLFGKPKGIESKNLCAIADRLIEPLTPPSAASLKLFAKITDEETSLAEAAELAAEDPILSTRILNAVNSAQYGLPQSVVDVRTATGLIGLDQLKILIMSQILEANLGGKDLEKLAQHCAVVGQIAGFLAMRKGMSRSVLTTLGVLHDIGRILASSVQVDQFEEFGALHPEIQYGLLGGAFARQWQLPSTVVRCVECLPFASCGDVEEIGFESRTMIDVLALAQFLANAYGFVDQSPFALPLSSVENLHMEENPKQWLNETQIREVHKTSLLF